MDVAGEYKALLYLTLEDSIAWTELLAAAKRKGSLTYEEIRSFTIKRGDLAKKAREIMQDNMSDQGDQTT